ncbi:HAMP domain-containing sensor histidine kinase, partial [Romboutsia sp.]|uniref:HAMP domain-containing sensor histidine kinase n=1 Tax=Romboutsia sp. TaxID=1965302 RepID=UPI002C98E3C0
LYSIVCKTPISSIKNSVETSSNFLFIIFIPIIALSIFMAIWFSNKFTKPIIQLTHISNKISDLDFDEKVHIYTNDEIEVLGNSINTLSSKIKNTMDDLKAKNEELEILINNKIKQEKLKREFVSSVSHELKTPITVIHGYAEGLRSNILDSEEDKQYYIDVICEESEKMGIMVNDLLYLYKLESNTFKIVKGKLNISDLIKSVVKKHEIILKDKEINIYLDLQEAYILGDKIRLEQVLNNLLDNAINHIDAKKQIKISTKLINNNIYIGVYNSGETIKENNLEKIWYSFVRLDKVRNSNDNRIGLGLSIVREILNLHDGIYGVENKKDGVEFWIELKKIDL